MKFKSTRGDNKGLSFEEALMTTYAKDGGLLMPEYVPKISYDTLRNWKNLSYVDIVKKIVSLFVSEDEMPMHIQSSLINKAFQKFDIKDVVKLSAVSDHLQVMELWHGESMAFKDLAMSCVAVFLEYFLERRQSFFTALVVTSGDTGASAALSICGKPNMDVVVMYPNNCISDIQEQMMTSIPDDNVHMYAVDGDMFECDSLLLDILKDRAFVSKHSLGTMNSMNCCRILVQMAHHIYAYLQAADNVGDTVDIVIPTGGAGNIAACFLAQQCGVPIRAHAITNENKCFYQFVAGNIAKLSAVIKTMAPAMDISFPLNFERIIWLASNQNREIVANAMKTFLNGEEMSLPTAVYKKVINHIQSFAVNEKDIKNAMKKCYQEYNYPVCPHTAVAMSYVFSKNLREHCNKIVVMATASPAKFPDMFGMVGLPEVKSEKVDIMRNKEKRFTKLEKGSDWINLICNQIKCITSKHTGHAL